MRGIGRHERGVGGSGRRPNLIAATTTRKGLSIRSELDGNEYPTGVQVSDERMGALSLTRDEFHGDWNYMLSPNAKTSK